MIQAKIGDVSVGEYVIVGNHAARKVTKVPDALDDSTSSDMHLAVPATAADTSKLPMASLGGSDDFTDGQDVDVYASATMKSTKADATATPTTSVGSLTFIVRPSAETTGGSAVTLGSTTAHNLNLDTGDTAGEIIVGGTLTQAQVESDTIYTVTFKAYTDNADLTADPAPTPLATQMIEITAYAPAAVTLDRHFAENVEAAQEVWAIDDAAFIKSWKDNGNHHLYAMAIELDDTDTDRPVVTRGNDSRYRGNEYVVSSGIGDDAPEDASRGDAAHRLSGTEAGRQGSDDALIVRINSDLDADPVVPWAITTTGTDHVIDDVDDEDVDFNGTVGDGGNVDSKTYLTAWFETRNDTGATVNIRSQAYQSKTTVVMQETEDVSGRFALRISTVPYGTATPVGDAKRTEYNETMAAGETTPMLPVNTRDVVTLASSDSSDTLRIETTVPSFTGLSPGTTLPALKIARPSPLRSQTATLV